MALAGEEMQTLLVELKATAKGTAGGGAMCALAWFAAESFAGET